MKTNRKLQLLAAATVAMLAINPAVHAQTPAPLSEEALLHALATGQVGFTNDNFTLVNGGVPSGSQLGVGGGDDEKVAEGTYYGGGMYLQGQPTASYGGGIYKNAAATPPVNMWYNDVYNNTGSVAAGDLNNDGYRDADADTYGVAAGDLNNDGYKDNDGDGIRKGTSQPANGIVADDTVDWYLLAGQSGSNAVSVYPGLYLQGQPTASYGGAIYHSTGSSLYGEDLPGDALYGEDLPGEALWGEDLPGEALTDAQLDALILQTLTGFLDQEDNCPVAPMGR